MQPFLFFWGKRVPSQAACRSRAVGANSDRIWLQQDFCFARASCSRFGRLHRWGQPPVIQDDGYTCWDGGLHLDVDRVGCPNRVSITPYPHLHRYAGCCGRNVDCTRTQIKLLDKRGTELLEYRRRAACNLGPQRPRWIGARFVQPVGVKLCAITPIWICRKGLAQTHFIARLGSFGSARCHRAALQRIACKRMLVPDVAGVDGIARWRWSWWRCR